MRIAICIVTLNRLAGLIRLINSVKELEFKKNDQPDCLLIIVDNDLNAPTEKTISEISSSYPYPVRFGVERNRGIASARNHAVRLADDCDMVAFIDDDEVADPNWLDELLYIQQEFNADIVAGPVLPLFETEVPKWILKGRFFDIKRFETGEILKYAATGNLLIRTELLKKIPGPFDERLNLTGGSDTLFSVQAKEHGAKMVWANDALVYEYQPKNRLTARWILRRAYRSGLNISLIEKYTGGAWGIAIRILKGLFRIFIGLLLLLPATLLTGYHGLVKTTRLIVKGIGEILGFFDKFLLEYY